MLNTFDKECGKLDKIFKTGKFPIEDDVRAEKDKFWVPPGRYRYSSWYDFTIPTNWAKTDI